MNSATVCKAISLQLLGPGTEVYRPEAFLQGGKAGGVVVKLVFAPGFEYPEWAEVQWANECESSIENLRDLALTSPRRAEGVMARLREAVQHYLTRWQLA